ncbi:hypothetical protein GcC1_066018 [Golovinomyces cichoracearum]|uniref:Uncharacterized protein n=1 Tax=Golovinomyces cichoracearum TaxID=62708 RepID=A0A420IRM0_9PEZI|nr:hypothetical protein GcC1_066018 [Golovinomyces cichoracearum]
MASGAVLEETLLPHSSEHQTEEINRLDSLDSGYNITQFTGILSHKITLDAPKLLPDRSIRISFYNPFDKPLFSIKDTYITAKTQLKDLIITLQNLLDNTIASESLESLLVKKIMFRGSIHQSCDRFSSHKSQFKDNSGRLILTQKADYGHVEKMGIYWTKIRDTILIDEESFIQRNKTPILEVYTIHKDLNAQSESMVEVKDATDCQNEIATPLKPNAGRNDSIIVEALGILQIPNDSMRDKNELGCSKTSINENKGDFQQFERSEKQESGDKEMAESNLIERMVTERNPETSNPIEDRKKKEKKENSQADFLIDNVPSLVRPQEKEQSPSYSHTSFITSPKNWGGDRKARGLNKAKATLYLENLDRNKFTTSHWSNHSSFVEDGFSVKEVDNEDKIPLTPESRAGRLTPKLAKELEIYRRSHESAISYANEDEEAFFPSSPTTIPTASTTRESRSFFNEKRQMTQLDLDKIVKDAVVRKMNRRRNANPNTLTNLEGNWNNDMAMDRLLFHSPGFTQDLSYNQEYIEFHQGENLPPGKLDESKEKMGGNDDPRSPMYYSSPCNQTDIGMSSIKAEIPYFMMNSFNPLEAESFHHMNQNLNFINSSIDGYANDAYSTGNLFDVAGGNYCAPRNSGGYFMDYSRHNGSDGGKNLPTHFFNNQMKFQDQFSWNRAYSNGIY